jgi:hypothetical protein
MLLITIIQAHVWEGEPFWNQNLALVYGSVCFGLMLLALVIRDYRLVHYGPLIPPSRQLTPEQVEGIRRALENHDFAAAIRSFRSAVPNAPRREAALLGLRIPRQLGRGLIEAPYSFGTCARVPAYSTATWPWPH